ncbi:MAG: YtxH domain-containing protein [Terriglobales bacterium]
MAESKGFWFLVGLTVGAVAGVLYAPQSGEQTRDLVQRKASDLRNQAGQWREGAAKVREQATAQWKEGAGKVREQASDYADRGRQAVTRQIDQFQAAVEAGKQAYREAAGLERHGPAADETVSAPKDDAASQL